MSARWSQYEDNRLRTLAEKDMSLDEMVRLFPGRTRAAVQNRLSHLGLADGKTVGAPKRPWTDAEDADLTRHWRQGESAAAIADRLGRSASNVRWRIGALGLRRRRKVDPARDDKVLPRLPDQEAVRIYAAQTGRSVKVIQQAMRRRGIRFCDLPLAPPAPSESSAGPMDRIALTPLPIDRLAARVMMRGEHWDIRRGQEHAHAETPLPTCPARPNELDMTGFRADDLTVVGKSPQKSKTDKALWVVRCNCGRYEHRTRKALMNKHGDHRCHYCQRVRYLRGDDPANAPADALVRKRRVVPK